MLTYRDAQEGEGRRQQRVRIEKLDPGVGPSVPRIKQLAGTRVTRWFKKIWQIFQRIAPKSCQVKKGQNIYNKAQFESPKHLHQTTFKTLKCLQQTMF